MHQVNQQLMSNCCMNESQV
uniref:Uncharacterized protein n=1 Tax=Anguilla anguilla TaxID=7936 RepID=A0A0E9QXE1_ANGAN